MIGSTISHYRIIEKLGEGGMGVVYKAEDTKLNRTVALKFLPPQALENRDDHERFVKEAQAAASLDHPNICTIYEIEDEAEQPFISMAFVDGSELREKIEQGPIPVERSLEYAIQIADGLRAAHEKGIIHRDIKTSNIMVTDRNQIKVMDFGLAKLIGSKQITKELSTMGTVAYMSPEQTGGRNVDHRSDIWALGVVMYEMLAGLRPFRGDYEQAVIYSIVNEDPEPLTALRTGVPMEFERIVFKALSKDPKARYQNVEDLIVDLRRLKSELDSKELMSRSGIRAQPPRRRLRSVLIPSVFVIAVVAAITVYFLRFVQHEAEGAPIPIAVVDIENQTGEAELDGLSGMLITALEQSRRLSVLTRARMYDVLKQMGRSDAERIDEGLGREICSRAGISALVVASIRRFDDLYTIDLKVLDMSRDAHLVTAKAEGRGKSSIPGMIDKLARDTRKGMKERSVEIAAASTAVADVTTPNLDAYQQYFLGEQYLQQVRIEDARDAFRRAIELDSTFALAQYRLAYSEWWEGESEEVLGPQLQKALRLIDHLPERQRMLLRAQNAVFVDGWEAGIKALKKMETVYPNDKEMLYNIGDYSFHAHNLDDAEKYLTRVLDMDPTFPRALNHMYMTYTAMGDKQEALEMAERYQEAAKSAESYSLLAQAYRNAGNPAKATEILDEAKTRFPDNQIVQFNLAMLLLLEDEYPEARSILEDVAAEPRMAYLQRAAGQMLVMVEFYSGHFRRSIERLELAQEMVTGHDTSDRVSVMQLELAKAWVYLVAWEDAEHARESLDRARRYWSEWPDTIKSPSAEQETQFWANNAAIYALLGQRDQAADIVEQHLGASDHNADMAKALVRVERGDFAGLVATQDSMLADCRPSDEAALLYLLGEAHYHLGNYGEAVEFLSQVAATSEAMSSRAVFYSRSFYLLGLVNEKLGDTRAAIAAYEKLLALWADADPDLTILVDARERLASLKTTSTQ